MDTTLTPEQKSFIQSQFDSESNKFFENFEKPVKAIYLDMEFLQDYRLGALMQMITTPTEYEYIKSQIDSYSKSDSEKITESFPALGFTEQQMDDYIKDPQHWERLALESPFYTNNDLFSEILVDASEKNILLKHTAPIDIFVYCNTFPFPMCGKYAFIKLFGPVLYNTNVNFMPTTLYEFQGRGVEDYDVYLVRHPSVLINHPSLVSRFESMEMTGKVIVGVVENKATEEDLKAFSITKEDAIKVTVEFANLFTHFAFAEHVIQV